ncbi:DUF2971 domain-containing protein [Paenarthrobacter nicotinovorans]|uniref:DUF2971 domain-containing protein n=1 Tax=Paenarthrobacter nicotinovorans TaxID=29320 RepID=UPI001642D929|nr:DUF2971 domain-containing protein [Paenarthrobacter nicotinovorans]
MSENQGSEPSNLLFHYTSAEVGIFNILMGGTLRLSPMSTTNDPWETEPVMPGFQIVPPDDDAFGPDHAIKAWEEIDRDIRLHSKLVSLTQDWGPADIFFDTPRRGWSHLSSWAHYGARQSGVCLGFDREILLEEFSKLGDPAALHVQGPVTYWRDGSHAVFHPILSTHLRKYGTDAVSRQYAEEHQQALFLSKHIDWANEYEYRLALMNGSALPEFIDISRAMKAVVVGSKFSAGLKPALEEALSKYSNVTVGQIGVMGHQTFATPYPLNETKAETSIKPSEAGDLATRVENLRQEYAEYSAERLKALSEILN